MSKKKKKEETVLTITKVRWNGLKCKIDYYTETASGKKDEFWMKSPDAPEPEMNECLEMLVNHALELIEIKDKKWGKTMRVLGANYGDDKAIIVISKSLESGHALNFNTPNLSIWPDSESEVTAFNDDCSRLLQDLREHAKRYLNGERAQQTLDFPEPALVDGEAEEA